MSLWDNPRWHRHRLVLGPAHGKPFAPLAVADVAALLTGGQLPEETVIWPEGHPHLACPLEDVATWILALEPAKAQHGGEHTLLAVPHLEAELRRRHPVLRSRIGAQGPWLWLEVAGRRIARSSSLIYILVVVRLGRYEKSARLRDAAGRIVLPAQRLIAKGMSFAQQTHGGPGAGWIRGRLLLCWALRLWTCLGAFFRAD